MIIVIACAGAFILLITAAIFWLIYAYRNPHTASGHWLLNHRRCRDFCCISKVTATTAQPTTEADFSHMGEVDL
jgi:hypothetical protein